MTDHGGFASVLGYTGLAAPPVMGSIAGVGDLGYSPWWVDLITDVVQLVLIRTWGRGLGPPEPLAAV